jgi:SAM-dependent methyltransferase
MLERARRLSDEEGLRNVAYEQADAQVHRFAPERFDLGISRFGTMFFADPVAAFANIGRALRPAARLVLMVWQDRERNEWASAIRRALAASTAVPDPHSRTPNPFSLADPASVRGVLDAAGFAGVGFAEVHEPVYYGRDSAAALDFVRGLRSSQETLAALDTPAAERALERLRATLAAHETSRGVLFDSRAWIVTARRR